MDILYATVWQNWNRLKDPHDHVKDELYLMELAEDLGFDAIGAPEHHFDPDYAAMPDNFMALSYLAGRTSTIKLFLTAAILPWNDPLRVVEKMALLDHMSDGRARLGLGRGLSKMEYAGFGLDMGESRERFDEAAEIVLRGLRTGVVEAETTFYSQPRAEIHPAPREDITDGFLCVGMSPDSSIAAAELGASLLAFTTKTEEEMLPGIQAYRDRFLEVHGRAAPREQIHDFMFCHAGGAEATGKLELYAGRYYEAVIRHYDFAGTHFAKTKGYESYSQSADKIREEGMDQATRHYIDSQATMGTPDEMIERFKHRFDVYGPTDLGVPCYFGGMSRDEAEASMRLFAAEVMPEIRRIND